MNKLVLSMLMDELNFQKNCSNSNMSRKSKINVSMKKSKRKLMRRQSNKSTGDKIHKLFTKLRNDSSISLDASGNETTVESSNNDTINRKRKFNEDECKNVKIQKTISNSCIVINDDNDLASNTTCKTKTPVKKKNSSPMFSSTPKVNANNTVTSLNTSKINNNSTVQNLNTEMNNLTKEINRDSYLTIDLTTETEKCNSTNTTQNTVIDLDNTVIDLENSDNQDCTVISISNASLSMSNDSDVTVIRTKKSKSTEKKLRNFANGIEKLTESEKGRLLQLITQKIFSGCKLPESRKNSLLNVNPMTNHSTETVEDTYIKEVILGQVQSRNSIGSNIYNPEKDIKNKTGLRMIVIDGSNVAMKHGKGREFSVKGLKICIEYFLKRGHVVKAFVPRFRCKFGKSTEPRLLDDLERQGLVVYTPSREVQGRMITSYDDRYIVQCAAEFDGVIVSGDNYRDLLQENPRWRFVIEKRLLQFTWVNDMIMFPKDPLGRYGPTLENFLKHTPSC